jgi:hypothetical protein
MKLYCQFAHCLAAIHNCRKAGNLEWEGRHQEAIYTLLRNHMPSGSGFDNGTRFNWDSSTPERLVFDTAFHHMDVHGGYAGWTVHTVIITPSLLFGVNIRVTGRNCGGIKDYIGEIFYGLANIEIDQTTLYPKDTTP